MCDTYLTCSSGRLTSLKDDAASIECTTGTCSERLCCTSGNEQKDKRYRAALEREDKIRDRGSQSALDDIKADLQALAGARNAVSAGATKQDRQQAVDTAKLSALSGVPRKILQRFLVAQLAGDLDADKGDVDLVVPKSDFARANRDADLNAKGIDNLLLRPVKTKNSDADCGGADIHIDELDATEFVEVILLEENDFSLKCHNGAPVSKVVLTTIADDDSDDSYEAFCRESVGWVSQGTFAPDSSFICSEALPGHVHWVASDGTGGTSSGGSGGGSGTSCSAGEKSICIPAASCRLDLSGDASVTAADIATVAGQNGKLCTELAGGTSNVACGAGEISICIPEISCRLDLSGDGSVTAADIATVAGQNGKLCTELS